MKQNWTWLINHQIYNLMEKNVKLWQRVLTGQRSSVTTRPSPEGEAFKTRWQCPPGRCATWLNGAKGDMERTGAGKRFQDKNRRTVNYSHKSAADFLLVFSRCVLSAGATWASRLSSKLCFLSPLRWKSESLKLQWVTRHSSSTHYFPLKWWTNTNLSYLFYKMLCLHSYLIVADFLLFFGRSGCENDLKWSALYY